MDGSTQTDSKSASLSRYGSLNPHPERVQDALFQNQIFFDPRDLVQVKYEMLRRVLREGQPPGKTAASFGFSRVTFYQVQERFGNAGLPGLLAQSKGPRRRYKISEEVLLFLLKTLESEPTLRVTDLSQRVKEQFEASIHPRSIERALVQRRKKVILFRQSAWLHLEMPPSCFSATKRSANRFCCPRHAATHLTRTVWSWSRQGWQPGSRGSPPP
jgi:transposase